MKDYKHYEVKAPCNMDLIGHKVLAGTSFGPAEYLSKHLQRFRFMTRDEMEYYYKKVEETKGFDVDGCPGRLCGRILPIPPTSQAWNDALAAAKFAASAQDKHLQFISLVKANRQSVQGFKYYVTFTAKDTKDGGKIKTFRARVYDKFPGNTFLVQLFEEAPAPPMEEPSSSREASVPMEAKGKAKRQKTIGRRGSALAGFRNLRERIKAEDPSLTPSEATKVASKKWKSLSIAKLATTQYQHHRHKQLPSPSSIITINNNTIILISCLYQKKRVVFGEGN